MIHAEVAGETRWRAPPPDTLVWACWDGDYVAYQRPSGKTHFLNESSYVLITDLLTAPTGALAVAQAFSNGNEVDADMLADMRDLLLHLEELGLVYRA